SRGWKRSRDPCRSRRPRNSARRRQLHPGRQGPAMTAQRPVVGVFDSGFGGLTVLREIVRYVPNAEYLYFGDTARLPYGAKSAETVARYAVGACHFLEQQGAEQLVIACNTATALAMDQIHSYAHVPAIGVVEPGAQSAAAITQTKNVAVIGTEAT